MLLKNGSKFKKNIINIAIASAVFSMSMSSYANLNSSTSKSDKPNIIFILADDIGIEGINSFGGEYYTPNIDKLAEDGISFTNAYATPLSSPSRTRIMTGIENGKNYKAFAYLDPTQKTFGNALKQAGYVTGVVGKWQLEGNGFDGRKGMTPRQAGFDSSLLWQENMTTNWMAKGSRYWGPTLSLNGHLSTIESGFGPDYENKFAMQFIHKNKDKPFFLYYPMVLVHRPFVPTPDSMNAQTKKDRFSGMVTYMDKKVGELVSYLKKEHLYKNTVIVFTGDNGTGRAIYSTRNGHTIRGGKGFPTLNGTHVPMIVSWPAKLPKNVKKDSLFDVMDIYPTIADIADHPVKKGTIDGISQLPVLEGKVKSVRDWIYMHYAPVWIFKPARFIFNQHWKLYGSGKFVKLDTQTGVETKVSPDSSKLAHAQYLSLKKQMDDLHDSPLNPVRFPMCKGHPSTKKGVSATIAGCTDFAKMYVDLNGYDWDIK